jgi:hypothetical protein
MVLEDSLLGGLGVCGLSWCCKKKLAPPGGELCGRGWSQLGGGHSGDALWRDYLGGKGERPRRWCSQLPIGRSPAAISY